MTETALPQAYALCARGFDRPDETVEELLEAGSLAADLEHAGEALGLEETDALVAAIPHPEELRAGYAEAFGFERGGEVPLYEVSYSTKTLLTSTHDLADIAGFYRAFDLELAADGRERVDHLCCELEFCADLATREIALSRVEDEAGVAVVRDARRSFLEDHLGRWVPRLAETVREEVDLAVYRELAGFLEAVVAHDCEGLGAEPSVFPKSPPEPHADVLGGEGDFRCGTCGSGPIADEH